MYYKTYKASLQRCLFYFKESVNHVLFKAEIIPESMRSLLSRVIWSSDGSFCTTISSQKLQKILSYFAALCYTMEITLK